ncbi:MAG: DUF3285 domain-containing protein [Cyanobacteriota bacterium]|nr:DUF3285 domain-containing protein [Cyanobacteriota bacterium]
MSSTSPTSSKSDQTSDSPKAGNPTEPQPSYVKLAMRNMVRKGSKSLFHFSLTAIALLGLLVGVSYITR